MKPSKDTLEAVHSWLEDNGIPHHRCGYSPAKDWVNVKLDIPTAERLLNSEFSVFEHEDGTRFVRTLEYGLPASLHQHVSTIQPTNSFMRTKPNAVRVKPYRVETEYHRTQSPQYPTANVSAVCNNTGVTPTCLRTLYGTIDYTPQVPGENKVGLNDFIGETNNRSDVSIFLQNYRPDAVSAANDFQFVIIANGSAQQTPDNATQLAVSSDWKPTIVEQTDSYQTGWCGFGGKPRCGDHSRHYISHPSGMYVLRFDISSLAYLLSDSVHNWWIPTVYP